ncbi:MAG: hypothetical protein LBO06_02045, partial [Bacteroidales bacterium]|nr:hypothetical protein [Bacteroidales bacterium]
MKKIKVLAFAVIALGFANSSFGQAAVGCPNFNFENGDTPWTNPDATLWWNAGWYYDHGTYTVYPSSSSATIPYYNQVWNYNSDPEMLDPHTSSYGTQRFFQIETNVNETDNFTGGQLKKVHPGSLYSARIGTPIGGTDASQLRYRFTVSAQNCLLTFYYAMVVASPSHTGYVNPTFQIDVVEGNGTNASAPLVKPCAFFEKNSNTNLPTLEPSVWHTSTFTDMNGPYIYCDWQRVTIDLADMIGHYVTARIRMSDCAQVQHGGWCYFLCEASNPSLQASGCSQGANIVEVVAPAGFAAYQWYINPSNN